MAVSVGTMARLKNGGAWSFFPGGPETAVEAFGPGVEIEIRTVGEVFDLETLPAVSAPTINQPDPIVVPFGTGFTDNMAARVSGGVPPYTFSQVQAAPLPLGVTITAGGNLTGSNQFPVGGYGWSVRVTDSRVTDGEDDPQSATINYLLTVEALPQIPPAWTVLSDQRVVLNDITPQNGTIGFSIDAPAAYAGTYTVDTAQLASGPVNIVPPVVVEASQNPGYLVTIPGLWLSMSETVTTVRQWLRDGTAIPAPDINFDIYPAYEIDTADDGGTTITVRETVTDANGARSAQGNGFAVPAAPISNPVPTVLTSAGHFFSARQGGTARTMNIDIGSADEQKRVFLLVGNVGAMNNRRIIADGVEYPLDAVVTQNVSGSERRLSLYTALVPAGGTVQLAHDNAITTVGTTEVQVFIGKGIAVRSFTAQNVSRAGLTAGTPLSRSVSTVPGDKVVYGIFSVPFDENGGFTDTTPGVEILDRKTGHPESTGSDLSQFYVALADAGSGSSTNSTVTPQVTGESVAIAFSAGVI